MGSQIETKALKSANSVICISETLRKEAISRGVSSEKITVVPNAVELKNDAEESELFHEMRVKLEGKLVIGYIGSLRELEGVDLTAEAVSILISQDWMSNYLSFHPNQDRKAFGITAWNSVYLIARS